MYRFLLVISILFCCHTNSYTNDFDKKWYDAFLDNNIEKWAKITSDIEEKSNMNNRKELLQVIHSYYGWTSTLIAQKHKSAAKKNIQKVEKYIKRGLEKYPDDSELLDYKGVFLGYKISINKLMAIVIGNTSTEYINKAYKLSPNHPQILFDKGNALYYVPKTFGGDKQKALFFFKKVVAIYEKRQQTKNNWVYLQALTLVGRCYELTNNRALALKIYQKIISIAPNFKLVKKQLYPQLINKK